MALIAHALLAAALLLVSPAHAQSTYVPAVAGAGANKSVAPSLQGGAGGSYAAGSCVGAPLAFNLAAPTTGTAIPPSGSLFLTGLTLFDAAKQDVALNAFVLNAPPSGTYTDKTACALSAGDYAKVVGLMQFGGYTVDGGNSVGMSDGAWSNGAAGKQLALGPNNASFYVILFVPSGGTAPSYSGNNLTLDAQVAY